MVRLRMSARKMTQCYTSDAKQWKDFDAKYPEFHDNLTNVRFVLSIDGMNLLVIAHTTHGQLSNRFTTSLYGFMVVSEEKVFVANHSIVRPKARASM